MYEYRAKVLNVVDGDTVDVDIDLGFDIVLKNQRVRIIGIDAPESRTRDKVEKLFGVAATNRVKELLRGDVVLRTQIDRSGNDATGKFGRILGDFIIGDKTLTEIMIEEGHGVSYHGGSKEAIRSLHLENRERLLAEGVVSKKHYDDALKLMEKNNER